MPDLAPCPFCGSEAAHGRSKSGMHESCPNGFFAQCLLCYAQGPVFTDSETAAKLWNRRAPEKATAAPEQCLKRLFDENSQFVDGGPHIIIEQQTYRSDGKPRFVAVCKGVLVCTGAKRYSVEHRLKRAGFIRHGDYWNAKQGEESDHA